MSRNFPPLPILSYYSGFLFYFFIGITLCTGSEWQINVSPEYCFSANKRGGFTLPKLTKNELKWTVWILSHISVHSHSFFLRRVSCLSWADCRQRLCWSCGGLLSGGPQVGTIFQTKSILACWHGRNRRFATKQRVLCLDSVPVVSAERPAKLVVIFAQSHPPTSHL